MRCCYVCLNREAESLGAFYHEMQIFSASGDRVETLDALVDTGASYSQVPGSVVQRLRIFPTGTVEAELADGRAVEEPAAEIRVRIDGLETFTWVTFGPEGVASLMGAHALEEVRLAVDPLRRVLSPIRILRMRNE
jgi:clan AA aspartic protease